MAGWRSHPNFRIILAATVAAAALPGCMGGSIARQVAGSIAMRVADKAVGNILDEPATEEPRTTRTNQLLMSASLDPYQAAFLRAQFATVPAAPAAALPPAAKPDPAASAVPVATRLATVEIWGLVIGEEKRSMLEDIRQLGIAPLPPEHAWEQWQLAEGSMRDRQDRPLLILIPPELGKMKSGDHAVIEIGMTNGLYVARDRLD